MKLVDFKKEKKSESILILGGKRLTDLEKARNILILGGTKHTDLFSVEENCIDH